MAAGILIKLRSLCYHVACIQRSKSLANYSRTRSKAFHFHFSKNKFTIEHVPSNWLGPFSWKFIHLNANECLVRFILDIKQLNFNQMIRQQSKHRGIRPNLLTNLKRNLNEIKVNEPLGD
jgi:hypothetical protein